MNAIALFLTNPAVAPFSGALAAVLAIFLVELILTIIVGIGFTDLAQALIDSHPLPDTSFTNWLLVKDVPLLMALLTFITGFGFVGIGAQALSVSVTDQLFEPLLGVFVVAVLFGVLAVRTLSRALNKLRFVHTTALTPEEFIGGIATLTSPTAYRSYSGTANFTDKHGYTHMVMVEPESDEVTFHEGDRVELVAKVSASLFIARRA